MRGGGTTLHAPGINRFFRSMGPAVTTCTSYAPDSYAKVSEVVSSHIGYLLDCSPCCTDCVVRVPGCSAAIVCCGEAVNTSSLPVTAGHGSITDLHVPEAVCANGGAMQLLLSAPNEYAVCVISGGTSSDRAPQCALFRRPRFGCRPRFQFSHQLQSVPDSSHRSSLGEICPPQFPVLLATAVTPA